MTAEKPLWKPTVKDKGRQSFFGLFGFGRNMLLRSMEQRIPMTGYTAGYRDINVL